VEPPLEKETQKYEISSHVTERMSDQNAFSEEKAKFKKKKMFCPVCIGIYLVSHALLLRTNIHELRIGFTCLSF
jgi:hypothetical protein